MNDDFSRYDLFGEEDDPSETLDAAEYPESDETSEPELFAQDQTDEPIEPEEPLFGEEDEEIESEKPLFAEEDEPVEAEETEEAKPEEIESEEPLFAEEDEPEETEETEETETEAEPEEIESEEPLFAEEDEPEEIEEAKEDEPEEIESEESLFAEEDEPEEIEEAEEAEPEEAAERKDDRPISADLIRGHINTIILRSLYDGDKYGYEIITEIEKKSHNQYSLKQPSLYSALKRLEREGYVTSYWGGSVGGGRRKYFSLTDAGKEISERNQSEWEYSRTVIDSLISDRDYDFSQPAPAAVDMRALKQSTSRVHGKEETNEEFEYDEYPAEDLSDELKAQRAAFEEERERYEESLRVREEVLRAREEAGTRREQELLEREFALQAEEERREQEAEQARLQAEEQARLQAEEQARLQAEEQARLQAEEQARLQAEEQARLQAEEQARLQAEEQARLQAEEQARLQAEEQARLQAEEQARLQAEEQARLQAEEDEIERARAISLRAEKEEQNSRIVEIEPFTEERERYEQMLRDQEAEFRAQHQRDLAEQEERIRREDELLFREREQQMIHRNYLNLVNTPPAEQSDRSIPYTGQTNDPESYVYVSKPENEREYRSIILKLYGNAVHNGEAEQPSPASIQPIPPLRSAPAQPAPVQPVQPPVQPAPVAPQPAPQPVVQSAPAPKPAAKAAKTPPKPAPRSLDGIDFYDLEMRATQDGIRIATSGGRTKQVSTTRSECLVHKGKAMFISAIVVFLLCIAEGSIALGFQNRFDLPMFYPYFIWGTGLALLLVTGLAFLNHFGERSLRQPGNLLVNTIVTYALSVIVILIVALAAQIDFADIGALLTYVIFPAVYFFGIIVFGVVYYLQIRPLRED